ncbi:hypothetical protein CALVIDRAFT_599704 [Calocera viscosa TUFC12733]|uniref:Uncharacterized protein n=1 Tax=Calocera viscosa (strain TUFC12733) TaxID=1330018 RepID=A0A167KGL7_CALVF|nr:hypothetical protein CALVIDRAFT_599704 [Calocera viscosa TUFC12733]
MYTTPLCISPPPRAPIHKLNGDVLLHLFMLLRDVEPLSIWAISRTCSRWRDLALQHSPLWSRIVIDTSVIRHLGSNYVSSWAELWIGRSGTQQGLDITIDLQDASLWQDDNPTWADIEVVLLSICRQAHRWRSFAYSLDNHIVKKKQPIGRGILTSLLAFLHSMPLLRTVHLGQGLHCRIRGLTPQYLHSFLSPEVAPQLHSLSLSNIIIDGTTSTSNVEQFCYEVRDERAEPARVLSALRAHPLMRKLHLSGWSAGLHTQFEHGRIVLERLTELHIPPTTCMAAVLSSLHMPNLTDLTLDARHTRGDDPVEERRGRQKSPYTSKFLHYLMFQPRTMSLITLTLHLPHHDVPWDSVLTFKSLEALRIVKPGNDRFWVTCLSDLWKLCKKSIQDDGWLGWSLPHLHSLILEETADYEQELREGWREVEIDITKAFKERLEAVDEDESQMVSLRIDIVGPNRKVEIRGGSVGRVVTGSIGRTFPKEGRK